MRRAAWFGIVFLAFGCGEAGPEAATGLLLEDADFSVNACVSSTEDDACAEAGGVGTTCEGATPLCCFDGALGGLCLSDVGAVLETRPDATARESAPPSPGGGGGGFSNTCDGMEVCRDVLVCVPAPITDKNLGCTFETRRVCTCIKTA